MDIATADLLSRDLALMAPALLLAGVGAGLIAGLLGVGGGIVVVPALYYVFGFIDVDPVVKMHMAVGTSLATIIATGFSSARAHWRKGAVDPDILRAWGPWVFAGTLAGALVAAGVRGPVLTAVFACIALFVAIKMGLQPEGWTLSSRAPRTPLRQIIATLIGGLSAMAGIGGGTFSVPVLSACGYPIQRAVGTASAIGLIIAVPGAVGFIVTGWGLPDRPPFSLGYVNLMGLALIVPLSVAFAPLGAKLAHAINPTWLKRGFALFLLVTALRMFAGLTGW